MKEILANHAKPYLEEGTIRLAGPAACSRLSTSMKVRVPSAATASARSAVRRVGDTTADRQNFDKMLLVFGCIGTELCK